MALPTVPDFTSDDAATYKANIDAFFQAIIDAIVGWMIYGAEYTGNKLSVSAQDSLPEDVYISPDGFNIYIVGISSDTIYQYTMSTADDISTASYASKSFSVAAQETNPMSLSFSSDGVTAYVLGTTNRVVYQYTLSTAWDISTASYASKSFSVNAQETLTHSLAFSSDGTTMYVIGVANDTIYQYTLSTAWDVSTASYASKSLSVSTETAVPLGMAISQDGKKVFVCGGSIIYEYYLDTAFDISTGVYNSNSYDQGYVESTPTGIAFSSAGENLYVIGTGSGDVHQHKTSSIML